MLLHGPRERRIQPVDFYIIWVRSLLPFQQLFFQQRFLHGLKRFLPPLLPVLVLAALPSAVAALAAELFLYDAKHKHPMCGGHTSH